MKIGRGTKIWGDRERNEWQYEVGTTGESSRKKEELRQKEGEGAGKGMKYWNLQLIMKNLRKNS